MEKKVIISDLTLSAAEGVAETKAKRFWENRMKPYEKSGFWPGILTVLSSIIPNMFRKVRFRLSFRRPKTSALIRSGRTNIWKTCWFPERLCAGQNILWPCSAKPETVQVLTDVSSVVCMQIHFICILTAKGLFILTGCWTTMTGFCRPR